VRWRFDQARTVAALDADFLGSGPAAVRHARDFATARRVRDDTAEINRLYVVESSSSLTGAMADHRLALKPSQVEGLARALARELGLAVDAPATLREHEAAFVRALARDLTADAGRSLVLAGEPASPAVHALAHALNQRLGNQGRTVEYADAPEFEGRLAGESLRALVDGLRAGQVQALVVLGGNPVYDAPVDLEFGEALQLARWRVHLSLYEDETSRLCHWHLPAAHFLETWSDARAHDGSVTLLQPMIAPLYGGKSEHELLAAMAGEPGVSAHDLLRRHWRAQRREDDAAFERFFARALHDGLVPDTRLPARELSAAAPDIGPAPVEVGGLELALRPDASAFDGRFANNGWLQELPRPLTLLTWDNAALLAPGTARALDLSNGDVGRIPARERALEAPVWTLPGQPEGTVTLHLGYGRASAGTLGTGVGVDAYRLRTSSALWSAAAISVERTGRRHVLASVQDHPRMEGRDVVRVSTFDRFRAEPQAVFGAHAAHAPEELSLYPDFQYAGNSWGMVIDLNACIGCMACTIACQAENNVPVVGKEQVLAAREMHWIRVDRYFEGDAPREQLVLHQPVPCMHCENAPCEVVCPVGATVHGDEGLNEMVYNRCVGTRYCANNCPYKVRRFNFLLYADFESEVKKLGNNPDVSVRSRGVMEKCTYCVQRINQARIDAKKEDREIREGDVLSACQQVCPTQAIAFGNINDPASRVSALRAQPHHYALLAELGTRPRTTYLAKLQNPSPELGPS
jgi:molybdopterin-containing oxidoreductase family iron-sulfur binding subunit